MSQTTEKCINGATYKVRSVYSGHISMNELLKLIIKKEIEKQCNSKKALDLQAS